MHQLAEQETEALVLAGLGRYEARAKVAEEVVGMRPSVGGEPILKVHVDYLDDLRSILESMPHRETYASRTGKRSAREESGGTPGTL